MRRRLAWVVLLLALLPAPGLADEPGPWRDPVVLEAALDRAIEGISAVTGRPYGPRPEIRASSRADLRRVLSVEMAGILPILGAPPETVGVLAQTMLAKYESGAHVIHVVPANARGIAEAIGEPGLEDLAILEILIVHEAVHAQDFVRFPSLEIALRRRKTAEGLLAAGATVEGHAQYLAERVARSWGRTADFERFTSYLLAAVPTEDAALRIVTSLQVEETRFAYVRGHRFFTAVAKARGEAGVEAALREPPSTVAEIEDPARWLDPSAPAEGPTPDDVVGAADVLFGREGWQEQRSPMRRGQVETVFEPLGAERDATIAAYEEGRVRVASDPTGGRMVAAFAARFRDPGSARAYVALTRALSEHRDQTFRRDEAPPGDALWISSSSYTEGLGPGRTVAGFEATKRVHAAGQAQDVVLACFHVGRFAVEITLIDVLAEEGALERAVAAMAARIEGRPEPALPAERLDPVPPPAPPATAPTPAEEPGLLQKGWSWFVRGLERLVPPSWR
jgi:hypothetical protein